MDLTDNAILVQQLKDGDEKAYLYLLNTYHRRLHAYALSLVCDQDMAQDMVQNVFLKTWDFRHRLDPAFSIESFLFKSVYNESINYIQKNKAMMVLQKKYVESLGEVLNQTSEESYDKMLAIVDKEISQLPEKCKQVFILSKKEGLTNQEIAEHLSVSVKTVEAQITKAFSVLRMKLGEKYKAVCMFFHLFYANKDSHLS